MANPLFPNVNPTPFTRAQLPFGLLGMSLQPQLPAVGGYSNADLERMRFQLMQSGADPAMLDRIRTVMAMRGLDMRTPDMEAQLLRETPKSKNAVGWRKHNPFDVLADEIRR
jgi:hypothetical protein